MTDTVKACPKCASSVAGGDEKCYQCGWPNDSRPAPCSLTAFLSLAFILAGLITVTIIAGLAVWLPIEITRDGETIKERGSINFQTNDKADRS